MPSIYVSTTIAAKLRLCERFFASCDVQTTEDLERYKMFEKMDMFAYFKQLSIRSLRSKRSCMIGLVQTLCQRYRVFSQVFRQVKQEYDRAHPAPIVSERRSKRVSTRTVTPKRTPSCRPTKHRAQRTKHAVHKQPMHKQTSAGSASYTLQPHTTQHTIYVGLDDYLQEATKDTQLDIQSLRFAIDYLQTRNPRDPNVLTNFVSKMQ